MHAIVPAEAQWANTCASRTEIAGTTVQPGRYQHFKGNLYDVIGVAADTETGEQYVVYVAADNDAKLWARPLKMFTELVQHEGGRVRRFHLVEPRP